MRSFHALFVFVWLGASVTASAEEPYRIGRVYNADCRDNPALPCNELSVVPRSQLTTAYTWYDPEVYEMPNGNLAFLAQAGNPSANEPTYYSATNPFGISKDAYGRYAPTGIDTMYRAERAPWGAWTTPALGAGPTLKGQSRRCAYNPQVTSPPPANPAFTPNNVDPVGGKSVVRIETSPGVYKYFMAYNGGNADYIVGKLYWAVSNDGVNWTPYTGALRPGYQWGHIVDIYYHDCNGGNSITGFVEGVGEPFLAFDKNDTSAGPYGTFYLYFSYMHYTPNLLDKTWYDLLAVRFGYNPAHPFGFGTNYQLFHDGQWRAHSGRLVFDYDSGPVYAPGDFKISIFHSMTSLTQSNPPGIGAGDIKRNPDTGQWLKLTTANDATGAPVLITQTNTTLATNNWTTPVVVGTANLDRLYSRACMAGPNQASIYYGPGLWYGTLGSRRGFWVWIPVHTTSNPGCFSGLGIVPAKLCSAGEPNCDA